MSSGELNLVCIIQLSNFTLCCYPIHILASASLLLESVALMISRQLHMGLFTHYVKNEEAVQQRQPINVFMYAIGKALKYCTMSCISIVAGYYVNSSGVPRVLRWLPRASLIKHAFEALCVNEFRGLEFEASAPKAAGDALTGEQVTIISSQEVLLRQD